MTEHGIAVIVSALTREQWDEIARVAHQDMWARIVKAAIGRYLALQEQRT